MYLYVHTHKPRTSATKICPLMWQRRQKAQRGDMSHSFSITELLPFTLCEQEQGSGEVWKAGDKLSSMWHNSSRKQQSQGPTDSCTFPCCQKEQLPRWTLHPWLGMPGSGTRATCASCTLKQEPGGCWTLLQHPWPNRDTETVWRQSWDQTPLWVGGSKGYL